VAGILEATNYSSRSDRQHYIGLHRSHKTKAFPMCIIFRKWNHHWLLWLLSALVVNSAVAGNPDAKRLYDDLLSNYNKLVRPVVNTSDVLRVCIKLKLSQLIDVVSFLFL
jgi:Neurotransmitter-gated ion-channel ligand binding domain